MEEELQELREVEDQLRAEYERLHQERFPVLPGPSDAPPIIVPGPSDALPSQSSNVQALLARKICLCTLRQEMSKL